MTLNDLTHSFKVTPFFDAEYLRNGTTYRHSVIEILIGTYNRDLHTCYTAVSFRTTLIDLERLGKIFSDRKHHVVSLRQLSFLFTFAVCPVWWTKLATRQLFTAR